MKYIIQANLKQISNQIFLDYFDVWIYKSRVVQERHRISDEHKYTRNNKCAMTTSMISLNDLGIHHGKHYVSPFHLYTDSSLLRAE